MESAAAKLESGEMFETVTTTEPEVAAAADRKYETVLHENQTNMTNVELTTVAVLGQQPREDEHHTRWVDAKLMEQPEHYAEEIPGIPAEGRGVTSATVDPGAVATLPMEHRGGGSKMRVTGEMPKAYSRGEKDSARKAFMLAAPVSIETTSEESDGEMSSPLHSSTEPTTAPWDRSEQHVRWAFIINSFQFISSILTSQYCAYRLPSK